MLNSKGEKIKYFQMPIKKKLLIAKIRENKSLRSVFKRKEDITDDLNKDLYLRINGMIENFFTMFVVGEQGNFKTSTGMTIAKRFDKTFNAERVSFQYEEFQTKFKKSERKQIHQLDEQVFQRGTGSNRLIQEIQELIETLRKRQNSMIVISPERKYFSEELFTYTLETIDSAMLSTCIYNKKLHEARTCNCYIEGISQIKEVYVRSVVKTGGMYIGFYICKIDWQNETWKEYSIAKDQFMQDIVEGKKARTDYNTLAKKLLELPEIKLYKTKKQLKLLLEKHHSNLTINESDLIIEAIQMIRQQTENQPKEIDAVENNNENQTKDPPKTTEYIEEKTEQEKKEEKRNNIMKEILERQSFEGDGIYEI